ncbi:hypothetical protein SAMN06272737_12091 [Blastococcus mobilis]|uniref:Uncharacterized protein n=1 Tax=Blastococcus mobilis TaxID=1938746 RepID=A0A238YL61_9ACTN|nr:hypothetical protein SAMN06272737_12091 [Blastococcus mobilis]
MTDPVMRSSAYGGLPFALSRERMPRAARSAK